jgi:tetratricopeptide (TPR) repeat protein
VYGRSSSSLLESTTPAGADDDESIADGTKLGRYVVLRPIGRGSHGIVVGAWDVELDREIAIKFLFRSLEQRDRQRLQHEAKTLARLTHPNVIRVHDVGQHGERLYMVMELVDGPTLAGWAATRRPAADVLRVMLATGRGLAAAHAAGIVHRDFKPANVLIGSDGRPRVTDFGQARGRLGGDAPLEDPDGPTDEPGDGSQRPPDVTLTRTGMWVGTPAYMAPELFESSEADERSDQFSFCVALYELLFGRRPFAGDTVFALAQNVLAGRVRMPPPRVTVRLEVVAAVLRGLSRDPASRFRDMDALLDQLAVKPLWRQLRFISGIAALGAGVGFVALASDRSPPPEQDWCAAVEARVDSLWNADRERTIAAAIAATGVPYGDDVMQRLRARIDPYVAELRAAERSTCEAQAAGTLAADVATARMLCLHRRHEEVRGLVDMLERADADLVEHATLAAEALAPVDQCTDEGALGPRWRVEDEATVFELDAAVSRERIAVEAWRDTSDGAQAGVLAARARAADQPWYEAEAELLHAHALDRMGDGAAAEPHFDAAFAAALAGEHHVVATAAALGLAGQLAARGDHTNALRWIEHAAAASRRAGADEAHWRIQLASTRGQVAYHHGDYAEALHHFEDALAGVGDDGPRAGPILLNMGLCLANLGRYEDSIAQLQQALAAEEAVFGPDHPGLLRPLNAMCHVKIDVGEFAGAIEHCQRAIDIVRATATGPQPRLSSLWTNLGSAHFHAGRYDEAERAHLAALDNAERSQPGDATLHATIHNNLGVLYGEQRKLDRAESHYRRARELLASSLGPEHPSTAMIETNLAMVLTAAGRHEEAETMLEGSLARMRERLGPDHVDLALSYAELARIHAAQGDHTHALPLFERALELREAAGGDPIELADTSWGLAQSLDAVDARRHVARVRSLARQASELYRQVGGERLARADEVELWLAESDARAPRAR